MASITSSRQVTTAPQWLSSLTRGRNWLYLLPALIFFIGYQLYPIIQVLWISFTDYHYLRQDPVAFVGFQNYANAFGDQIVYQGLLRAAYFTAIFLPGTIFLPMFVAILVDRVRSVRI